jgi:hypothetical protein
MKSYVVSVFPGGPDIQTVIGILYVEYVPIQALKLPNVSLKDRYEHLAVIHLRQIEQLSVETTYAEIVENLAKKMDNAELYMDCDLVMFQNDQGAPLSEFMRLSGLLPIEIHISTGDLIKTRPRGWDVPRRDLVNSLSILSETKRFLIAEDDEDMDYTRTIEAFEKQLTYYTEDSERIELLMCAAMGCWWIVKQGGVQQPKQPTKKAKSYNPMNYGI